MNHSPDFRCWGEWHHQQRGHRLKLPLVFHLLSPVQQSTENVMLLRRKQEKKYMKILHKCKFKPRDVCFSFHHSSSETGATVCSHWQLHRKRRNASEKSLQKLFLKSSLKQVKNYLSQQSQESLQMQCFLHHTILLWYPVKIVINNKQDHVSQRWNYTFESGKSGLA